LDQFKALSIFSGILNGLHSFDTPFEIIKFGSGGRV
jgi:hypothetical protein